MKVLFTLVSRNKKTGPIPVSTTSKETCPNSCPYKNHGCYAETGVIAIWWRKVSRGEIGLNWNQFLNEIKKLHYGALWRHNQAGDLPGKGESIDAIKLAQLVMANRNRKGFTYTHKYTDKSNLKLIRSANKNGFTINLSGNSLAHADELVKLKVGPVTCVLPSWINGNKNRTIFTPKGNKVVICPATYMDNVTCASCRLCQRVDRSVIIGFPAHGIREAMVSNISANF